MLTTAEAAALLSDRGMLVKGKNGEHPPTARTIEAWCRSGALKSERKGGPRRGIWLVSEDVLRDFEPPVMGRQRPVR